MAEVAVAVAVTAATGAAGVALGTTTVAAAAVAVGTTAVLGGISHALADTPKAAEPVGYVTPEAQSRAPANSFRTVETQQALPPRRFALGRVRTTGALFYMENANPKLYVGTILSDGVVEALDAVYVGDTAVPIDDQGDPASGTIYTGNLALEFGNGATDQVASTVLTGAFSGLTTNFRQRGVARMVAELDWGDDATEHSTLWPTVRQTYLIKGVKVYDPREMSHSTSDRTTWAYSSNPALLILFVLVSAWDVAIAFDQIDMASFEAAADYFDTTISYNDTDVPLFELAGIFQSGYDLASQIDDMQRSCGARITFESGKYGLAIDQSRTTVWTIIDDDVLEIGEYTAQGSQDATPNSIKARFYDANDGGTQTTTPLIQDAAAQATEGYREAGIDLGFTPYTHSAQILAKRELEQARDGRTLTLHVSDAGLYLNILDRVTVNLNNADFVNGDYSVVQVDLAPVGAILQLRGYASAAYADPATYLV